MGDGDGDADAFICLGCGFGQACQLNGEIGLRFPGLAGLKKPVMWIFPKVYICAFCGLARFRVPKEQLATLSESVSTSPSPENDQTD